MTKWRKQYDDMVGRPVYTTSDDDHTPSWRKPGTRGFYRASFTLEHNGGLTVELIEGHSGATKRVMATIDAYDVVTLREMLERQRID